MRFTSICHDEKLIRDRNKLLSWQHLVILYHEHMGTFPLKSPRSAHVHPHAQHAWHRRVRDVLHRVIHHCQPALLCLHVPKNLLSTWTIQAPPPTCHNFMFSTVVWHWKGKTHKVYQRFLLFPRHVLSKVYCFNTFILQGCCSESVGVSQPQRE